MKHVRDTIECLMRRARAFRSTVPFPFEDIPALSEFHETVKQYKVTPDFFSSTLQLRLHERADWNGSAPTIKLFAGQLIGALQERGFPVYAHTAYRSPALQKQLEAAGHSQLKSGPHQRGCAVDIVHSLYHWRLSNDAWRYIGIVGKEIIRSNGYKIEWGGDWKHLYDPGHWQLADWRNFAPVDLTGDITPVRLTPKQLRNKYV